MRRAFPAWATFHLAVVPYTNTVPAYSAMQLRVQNYQFGTSYAAFNETCARLWLTQ